MQVRSVEKRGKSVDEAIKAALDELGCEVETVNIEIIEESSKGFLGIGSKPAVVRVSEREKPQLDAKDIVVELLDRMNIRYQVDKVEWNDNTLRINIIGEDMGLLIGRKGETLNAVQFLAGMMINRRQENKIHLVLDVEDYRRKRETSLEELALRLADKVKQSQKNVVMRPMSSQERRIIHTVLQGDPKIATYSTGDEPNRKVVISLKK